MNALLVKEWLEMKRNLKLLWLPIVFAILGLTQPLIVKFLPEILKAVGGIQNADALTQMMGPTTPEVILGQTLASQFDQLGIIIFAVAAMGTILADRTSGMLAFIMTRPVELSSYIGTKWLSQLATAFCALLFGYALSAYYTILLFGHLSLKRVIIAFLIYFVWFCFVVGIVILASAFFKSSAAVASTAVVLAIVFTALNAVDSKWLALNPAYLSKNAVEFLASGKVLEWFYVSLVLTVIYLVALFVLTLVVMRKKPLQVENH
ncbi:MULTISPECIES: ABC transporter permease [Listeria]|uniref:ABC transporter permease n=1 Tax=Listeria TaxID=1637 RepID=UPI000B594185|nr:MULTISPECIES: ABC transporter permease subunit [Listeria]